MPTPAERRALLFVATVATLGVAVRGCAALSREPPPRSDRESLARQLEAVDSAIASGGRRPTRASRSPRGSDVSSRQNVTPAKVSELSARDAVGAVGAVGALDMDHAGVEDLERLPGIGPALAKRIVADRESRGPFGSIEGFQRVKGVGPALAKRVQPHVTFSLPARPPLTEKAGDPARAVRRP